MTTTTATGKSRQASQLTIDDVCVIIARCYHHKVAKLSFRDLELTFDTSSGRKPQESVDQFVGEETPAEQSVGTAELPPDQHALREELRLAQLMLDNPLAYEQEMIDANLDPRKLVDGRENNF